MDLAPTRPLGSVVIPAHDEAAVIDRCLDALFAGFDFGELDVVAVCNGCADGTADVARASGHQVRVRELGYALNQPRCGAGRRPRWHSLVCIWTPTWSCRIGGPAGARATAKRGARRRPPVRYETSGASAPVRSYYRARSRLPAMSGSLWGAGVYGLRLRP